MKLSRLASACLFALAVLGGCASTHVTARHGYTGERIARPGHIIVHDFAATPTDVPAESSIAGKTAPHGAPQTSEQLKTGRKLGAEVAKELVTEIRQMGLPAAWAADGSTPQVGDLVIRGYFLAIDEGSAGERVLVGFGQGAADLRAAVEGYQMTPHGLRLLGSGRTDSAGGKTPGMLVGVASLAATGNPVGLIVGGASKLMGEKQGSGTIGGAAQRTAKEIGDQLRIKFKGQGWI